MRLLLAATIAPTLRNFYLPFAAHFRKKGWRVDGAAQGISECAACREAFDHVIDLRWSRNPLHPRNLFRTPAEIREAVQAARYDIVHVSTPVASFVTRFALRGMRPAPKVIYTAHGFHFHDFGSPLSNFGFAVLERLAARWTDYITVMNQDDLRLASRFGLRPRERVVYIAGVGIDRAHFSPGMVREEEVERFRASIGLQGPQPLLLMVAEFIPRKRHSDAVRAFASLSHPGVHLAFAGDGPTLEPTRRLARKLGVEQRVIFLGMRRTVAECVRASAAVILPSEREGLPRSIMEALALAVPVIASDIRGNRDLLEQGGGLLFPLGHIDGLARSMDELLRDRDSARLMGQQGRANMAKFCIEQVLDEHERLYAEAMKTDCAPRYVPEYEASQQTGLGPSMYRRFGKRLLDIVISISALAMLWPVMVVTALLVRRNLGSPILYRQRRPGLNERPFSLVKFRTMLPEENASGEVLPDGERVTPFGVRLRSTSLDELLQVWNILRGEMSVVGPRPLLERYLPYYTSRESLRHTVRPGLTGWAQLNGRNDLSWDQRLELDAWYVEHVSLRLDLTIIWRTLSAVLARRGVREHPADFAVALDEARSVGILERQL